jgi:predicted nucleic acid-binding protein
LPAHGVTTIFYLAQKERTRASAKRMVSLLLSVFGIAAVDEEVLSDALALACPDFEDAVCAAAAKKARCDFLVTRDPKGFRGSPIRVLDPVSALAVVRAL